MDSEMNISVYWCHNLFSGIWQILDWAKKKKQLKKTKSHLKGTASLAELSPNEIRSGGFIVCY